MITIIYDLFINIITDIIGNSTFNKKNEDDIKIK
jgi:hypothetical protein